jgi:DNA-binding transcriptional ArsR family regulator
MNVGKGGEASIDWTVFVPPIVNPTKVTIIQALARIRQPLSAGDVLRLIDDPGLSLSRVAYHLASLADNEALTMVPMGGTETLYVLPSRG